MTMDNHILRLQLCSSGQDFNWVKAKFYYTSWFGAGSKPNFITLSDSNQLRTSSEPASVMEFGF